jgi:hypothetical protein
VLEYLTQMPSEDLAPIAYELGLEYNAAFAVVDVTGGYGQGFMREFLKLGYPIDRVYHSEIQLKVVKDGLKRYIKKGPKNTELVPGMVIGQNRGAILGCLQRAVREGNVIVRSRRTTSEWKQITWNQTKGRWDHSRSGHDDLTMSLAMGLFVREFAQGVPQLSREQWMKLARSRAPRSTISSRADFEERERQVRPADRLLPAKSVSGDASTPAQRARFAIPILRR